MKHLLIVGHISSLAPLLCQRLSQQYHIVVLAKDVPHQAFDKTVDVFTLSEEDSFSSVMRLYQFSGILFLGSRSEQQQGMPDEENMLGYTLSMADRYKIPKIVYFTSFELSRVTAHDDEREILLRAREQLCAVYRRQGRNVITVRLPYVFGVGETDTFIGRLMHEAATGNALELPLGGEEELNFISAEDVVQLVRLLLEEDVQPPEGLINVCGGETMTGADLCAKLAVLGAKVSLAARPAGRYACPPMDASFLRRNYGYVAVDSLSAQLQTLFLAEKETLEKPPARLVRLRIFLRRHALWVKGIELVLGYGLMELLNALFGTTGQFRFLDFRLLYVVLMGSTHGLQTGLIASVLACFSAARGYAAVGLNAEAVLYNVVNWLPFASLVLIGSATGYIRDKRNQELTFTTDNMHTMEKRYTNLQNLYQQALKSKDELKDQVISYRDSFGRIYDITSRLNVLNPEEVFAQAVPVLEEALDNQSIAIYTIGGGAEYARLNVSSKGLNGSVPSSLELQKFQPMMEELKEQGVFGNRRLLEDFPFYCAPILNEEGNTAGLVMMWEAYPSQMTLYYQNLFKVLCQMVHDSLMRAIAYDEAVWETKHFPATFVLLPEHFRQALMLKEKMRDEQMLDFTLLQLEAAQMDLQAFSNAVAPRIRHVDLLGRDWDGAYYLILMQVKARGMQIVLERLAQVGIACRQMDAGEIQKLLANPPEGKDIQAEKKEERVEEAALRPVDGPLMPVSKAQAENQRAEQTKLTQLRLEQERLSKLKEEQERLTRMHQEQERLEQERIDHLRRERERLNELHQEQLRLEELQQEQLRRAEQRAEQARQELIRQERVRANQMRKEQEAMAQQHLKQQRLTKQRLEQVQLEQQRLEQLRIEQQQLEQQRLEQLRLEQEQQEQQKAKQQQLLQLRLEQQQMIKKHQEEQQAERQRMEQMSAEIRQLELSLGGTAKEQASQTAASPSVTPYYPAEEVERVPPPDRRMVQTPPPADNQSKSVEQQLMRIQSMEQERFIRQRAEIDRLNQQRRQEERESVQISSADMPAPVSAPQIPTPQVTSFPGEQRRMEDQASRRERIGRRLTGRRSKVNTQRKGESKEGPLKDPAGNRAAYESERTDERQLVNALPARPELRIVPSPKQKRS